jgi:molecular chaperone Hsp33
MCYNVVGEFMKDYVIIGHAYNKTVRIYTALSTRLVNQAQDIHQSWPTASAAMGRFLTVSAMMGLMYKDDERLTLRIKGDGPIGSMTVEANGQGEVRADIFNPNVYFTYEDGPKKGKLNVAKAVGKGFLYVTKDLNMKDYYTSTSEIVSGEIAEDFTYYFTTSEQTNSSVGLGVLVNPDNSIEVSGGYILQLMPGVSEETISRLEALISNLKPVTTLIQEGHTPETLFDLLSGNEGTVLKKAPIKYHCPCSYNGFMKSLSSLSIEALEPLAYEDHGAEITCHFCHKTYHIKECDLVDLIEKKKLSL